MLDAVRNYLSPKPFGTLAYVCSIIHILCGLIFTWLVIDLKGGEAEKFTCYVSPKSTSIHNTQVQNTCFSRYQQYYNAPLRFYIFVLLSTWFPIFIAVAYSLWVIRQVEHVESNINETQADGEDDDQLQNHTFYVFRFYLIHLVIRVLSGVLFIILQHTLLFPESFDFKFDCRLPPREFTSNIPKNETVSQLNNTSILCENAVAPDKHTLWMIISSFNAGFTFTILVEIIRLCTRFPIWKYIIGWEPELCDAEFIRIYLLRRYIPVDIEQTSDSSMLQEASDGSNVQLGSAISNLQQASIRSNLQQPFVSSNLQQRPARMGSTLQPTPVSSNLQQCLDNYKRQVLRPRFSTGLDKLHITLVIYTERAPHKFSKRMERHEIYNVYMKVPQNSLCFKDVENLFYPNKDTNHKFPRRILVVGRPGIGKTVLTEKIMHDWANGTDKFYHDKIALHFKVRWFNMNDTKDITLKTILRYGTQLNDQEFEKIYEVIIKQPEKAILIFDGLSEYYGNFEFLHSIPPPNDSGFPMPWILLVSKLIAGHLLPKATILVTSTREHEFHFDRTVEIIGFTAENIEDYVIKFCQSHDKHHVTPKIWNHIRSSSELLSLCYIPVICWIVSTVLFESLEDPANDTDNLPTTLTELYQAAVTHFNRAHYRNRIMGGQSREATSKLQSLAFKGIESMQLIFDSKFFDEQMKRSGLLNSLSNPHFQAQTQFCFIHLTIQEFLAAKHVIEMFSPEAIQKFIFSHIKSSKWHLVLQFIAGLLGRQIKMFQKERYKNCVLAFAKSFELKSMNGKFNVATNYTSLLIMKCLREVEDEEIVKEACETTAINDIVSLTYDDGPVTLTSSDWSAIFLVCKHMKNLKKLDLGLAYSSQETYLQALRLLEQRCVEELLLCRPPSDTTGNIFTTLMAPKCSLNHEHSKLTKLHINQHRVTDEILSSVCDFFRNGHATCLKELSLLNCEIRSRKLSILCEVFDNKLCRELTCLDFRGNNIADEGLTKLCKILTEQKLLKLTGLNLRNCSLTDECVPALCELLRMECCNLIYLSLSNNPGIKNEGLRILCEHALTNEHCKLERLDLGECSLTDECIPDLRKTLQDEHCRLNRLRLEGNDFTKKGRDSIGEISTDEQCQARGLKILLLLGHGLLSKKGVRNIFW